jgi:phosphoribosylformylglycinamidine cyclo-ligase
MNDPYNDTVIKPGDRASLLARNVCYNSHGNNDAVHIIPHQPENFRGPVSFIWNEHIQRSMLTFQRTNERKITSWTMAQSVENDGAGGKPQFFSYIGTPEVFAGLGWEIISMTADDFARSGRLPVLIDNEINVQCLTEQNFPLFEAMMAGYGAALAKAKLINITGETAVMKNSITAFCDARSEEQLILTWGASSIGLTHRELLIDGSKIKPGQTVIGFWEPGYRCNGGSFFTLLILQTWGPKLEAIFNSAEAHAFIKKLTVPSQSYARTICDLIGWNPDGTIGSPLAKIYGIAHITGGGLWGKFEEILPPNVGAYLDKMPEPAEVLLEGFELSQSTTEPMTPHQAYQTFHGGCGMLLVCDNADADAIISKAQADGIKAMEVGHTTSSDMNEIEVMSYFGKRKMISSLEL